ncbi:SEL1-like repeat protein [Neisseria zalophi]|uniref:Sel1 repeat family protein n=1 Tax=Neisseria zalophi TaxID=640030 RepID=A0A5J6PUJ1_9NEIS|nr:sel1 repeat family protein [Neisseria zalophi]QEY26339.1 sel1 repeat family protein [Neisseria zalophi]
MKYLLFLLLINITFNSVSAQNEHQFSNDKDTIKMSTPISTGSIYFLDKKTQVKLKKLAEKGDINAAFQLSQYFTLINKNNDEALKYLLIGARNGDVRAQYRVSQSFFNKKLYKEALFWAQEAKKNGISNLDEFIDPDEFIDEIKSEMNNQI